MFKWLFYAALIVTALYFWGDFRVNDVNVRDTLHEYISMSRIRESVHDIQESLSMMKDLAKQLKEIKAQSDAASKSGHSQESISTEDQQKLRELMDQSLKGQTH